jgi:simple sugar transport system permease protein
MTPLVMTALAFIAASRAGVINLGLEGQMLCGALVASFAGILFPWMPKVPYVFVITICSMAGGMLWALLPGYLKIRFGASEIVTTIMLNYVMEFFLNFIISGGFFKHPSIDQRTPYILDNARLKSLSELGAGRESIFRGVQLNAMFPVALVFVFLLFLFLNRTRWGYKINVTGLNLRAANANGINSRGIMLMAMCVSGAIAGAAALGEVLGTFRGLIEGFSPGYGFSGISVALLGRNHPVGTLFGGLFFGIMNQGTMYISANTTVPRDFVKVLQTLIIVFIIIGPYLESLWMARIKKSGRNKEAA